MGATTILSSAPVTVEPGETVTSTVAVQNEGSVVDEFTVDVLGAAAAWATVEPAVVRLMPGKSATVNVHFSPPRTSELVPGPIPFGVRIHSREDPAGGAVEEGVLVLGRFASTTAELLPRTSTARGRRSGKHELAIDNRGNIPLDAQVTPTDPTEKLVIELARPSLPVAPGQAAFLPVRVHAARRFWRGPAVTHNFQLLVEPGEDSPLVVDGTFVQEALIPRWLPRLLALLLALVALAALLWFTLLKPAVKDAARDQAAKTAQAVGSKAGADAARQVLQGQPQPTTPGQPTPPPPVRNTGQGTTNFGTPYFFRLQAGSGRQAPSVSIGGQIVSVTDLAFQNPRGDSGLITLTCGGTTLYQTELENFRDLDFHFIAPVPCGPHTSLTLNVQCQTPGSGQSACTPAVSLDGYVRKA